VFELQDVSFQEATIYQAAIYTDESKIWRVQTLVDVDITGLEKVLRIGSPPPGDIGRYVAPNSRMLDSTCRMDCANFGTESPDRGKTISITSVSNYVSTSTRGQDSFLLFHDLYLLILSNLRMNHLLLKILHTNLFLPNH
jgi:hypothetical protein